MKTYYDIRANDTTFQAGDFIWLYNPRREPGLTPKFMHPWEGPYVVTKQINDLVYQIQLSRWNRPKVLHRNHLWEYTGSNPPTWYHSDPDQTETSP